MSISFYAWIKKKFLYPCSSTSKSTTIIRSNPIEHTNISSRQASITRNDSLGIEVELSEIDVQDINSQRIAINTLERKDNDVYARMDNIELQLQKNGSEYEKMKLQLDKITKTIEEIIWKLK